MLADQLTVEVHLGIVRRGAEADERASAAAFGQIEPSAVAADHLVNALVKIMEGRHLAGVRQAHLLNRRVLRVFSVQKLTAESRSELPVIVDIIDLSHDCLPIEKRRSPCIPQG